MVFDNPDSHGRMDAGLGCIVGLFSVRPVYLNNEDPEITVIDGNLCGDSHMLLQ